MTDREGRITLLGYICMAVLINFNIAGIGTTPCTDKIKLDNLVHVRPMCVSGTLSNIRLVIDSWDTGDPDVYSCICTVTLDTGSAPPTTTTKVVVEEYPEMSPSQNCGSVITINSTKSNSYTETRCTRVPSTLFNNFETSDILTLTLSRADVTTPWTSGHCILISQPQGSGNPDFTVTCKGKFDRLSTTTTKTTTTTTTHAITSTTESATTTTPIVRTTTKSMRTSTSSGETTVNSDSNETTSPDTNYTPTTTRQSVPECHPVQGYPLSAVLVPLVVSILMVSVGTAANVVLYKRRFTPVKQPGNTDPNMTSPNMNNYDSLDLSRVEPPNVYADTASGQMYVNTTTGS